MKEVKAIIRPFLLSKVVEALELKASVSTYDQTYTKQPSFS